MLSKLGNMEIRGFSGWRRESQIRVADERMGNDMVMMLYEKGATTASVLYNPICVRVQSYRTELHQPFRIHRP